MKSGRILLSVATVVCALAFFASNVLAGIYTCEVKMAGPIGNTKVQIVLSDTADPKVFENKTFVALDTREKEMLAVALAAIQSGMHVQVSTNPSAGTAK